MTNAFGERLKMLMNERKLNQVQLADALEIKKQSINSYIKGKSRPELDVLIRFADYFECSVDFLLGREDFRSRDSMKTYDRMIEKNFSDSLQFMGIDRREYYLEAITQNTRSYCLTEGKEYSTEHFDLTMEVIEQVTAITALIAEADRNTAESRQVTYSVGQGKSTTLDSHSAEYVLLIRNLLQTRTEAACDAVKALGDIGFHVLEKHFPQIDDVLNGSKRDAEYIAKEVSQKLSALSTDGLDKD
jgi:transcriptional regulator with XRE-family HTH domain